MKSMADPDAGIIFPEWSPINGNTIQRRDFAFNMLVPNHSNTAADYEQDIFGMISERGEDVYIPQPQKAYKPMHFLELEREVK